MLKTKCPYCSYRSNRHETLKGGENTRENDISFCANCGEISAFKNKGLVKIDLNSLDGNTKREINDIRVAWLKQRAISGATK